MYNEKQFIVDVGETIDEKIKYGTLELYQETTDDKYLTKTKRYGNVISVPEGEEDIKEGDKVYFHHNITRKSRFKGRLKESPFYIRDGKYLIPKALLIAFEKDGEITMYDDNVFVKPVDIEEITNSGIIIPQKRVQMYGKVQYTNKKLASQGVHSGDFVIFDKHSEYRFWINDVEHYRMRTDDILLKIHGKEGQRVKIEGVYNSKADRVKQSISD